MAVRGSTVIRASAALTADYVAGTAIDTTVADEVVVLIAYTMGASETSNSIVFKGEWSDDGGTTYYTPTPMMELEETQTSGAVNVYKTEITFAAVSAAATYDYIAVTFPVLADKFKLSIKESGVAANYGTCAIRASLIEHR